MFWESAVRFGTVELALLTHHVFSSNMIGFLGAVMLADRHQLGGINGNAKKA